MVVEWLHCHRIESAPLNPSGSNMKAKMKTKPENKVCANTAARGVDTVEFPIIVR